MNEALKKKLNFFIDNLSEKDVILKKRFHYNSVINLTREIVKYREDKALDLKKLLNDYFDNINYKIIDERESISLFKEYLMPIGNFLVKEEKFISNTNLFIYTVIGVIIDLSIFSFGSKSYVYPIFSLSLFIIGFIKRIQHKKDGTYFSPKY